MSVPPGPPGPPSRPPGPPGPPPQRPSVRPPGPPPPPLGQQLDAASEQAVQRAVLQEAEAEARGVLMQQQTRAGDKRKGPEEGDQEDPGAARDALVRMQEQLRRDREAKQQQQQQQLQQQPTSGFAAIKERGMGDWVNYQPPSAVLAQVAARKGIRISQPPRSRPLPPPLPPALPFSLPPLPRTAASPPPPLPTPVLLVRLLLLPLLLLLLLSRSRLFHALSQGAAGKVWSLLLIRGRWKG